MRFLIYIFCLSILQACKTKVKLPSVGPDEIEFSISKGGCFGTCPVYNMEIFGGGKAIFIGEKHTEKIGTYTRQLGEVEYNSLRERIATMNIRQYQDEYESVIYDLPLITVAARDMEGLKEVAGKEQRPDAIVKLQSILENLAESEGWVKLEDLNPEEDKKEDKNLIKSEIILEPASGTLLPPFFKRLKTDYGVEIKQKLTQGSNLWLITYDEYKISGNDLLEALKSDKAVKNAEFNKKITKRSGDN